MSTRPHGWRSHAGSAAGVAVACIAALALGACSSSYKGLSKADFVKQAEAVCAAGNKTITSFTATLGKHPTLAQVKSAYSHTLVPALQGEVKDLRTLKPPKADRAKIKQMLDDLSTGVDEAASAIASIKSLQEIQALQEPAHLKSADTAAKAYGLSTCASSN